MHENFYGSCCNGKREHRDNFTESLGNFVFLTNVMFNFGFFRLTPPEFHPCDWKKIARSKVKRITCHTKIDQLLHDMSHIHHHSLVSCDFLTRFLFISAPHFPSQIEKPPQHGAKIHKYIHDVQFYRFLHTRNSINGEHFYDFNVRISPTFQLHFFSFRRQRANARVKLNREVNRGGSTRSQTQ